MERNQRPCLDRKRWNTSQPLSEDCEHSFVEESSAGMVDFPISGGALR